MCGNCNYSYSNYIKLVVFLKDINTPEPSPISPPKTIPNDENNIDDADDPYATKNSKNDKIYCNENDKQYKTYSSTLITNTPVNPSVNPTTDQSKDPITESHTSSTKEISNESTLKTDENEMIMYNATNDKILANVNDKKTYNISGDEILACAESNKIN